MANININQFAGLAPSISDRNRGVAFAATANNLFAPTQEFRPLAADTTLGVTLAVNNPVTLYKRNRTTAGGAFSTEEQGWYSAAGRVSLVKGQIDDDETERTYFTYDDGSNIPYVSDVSITKPLGVTPPAVAPTVTHNIVYKYTTAEDTAARRSIPLKLRDAVIASSTLTMMGAGQATMSSGAASGWLPHGTAVSVGTLPTVALGDFAYCSKLTAGVLVATDAYMTLPSFGGRKITYLGSEYWAIPVSLQSVGWLIDAGALTTSFKNIAHPDPDFTRSVTTGYTGSSPTTQFVPDAACAASAATIQANYAVTTEPQRTYIQEIAAAQAAVEAAVKYYANAGTLDNESADEAGYAVSVAVRALGSATKRLTDEYLSKNENWQSVIENIFDADGGFASSLPEPKDTAYETRFYLTTLVTTWGEESAPSPVSVILEKVDDVDTCTVTAPATTGAFATEYIAGWRLYRSNSGTANTEPQLVSGKSGETGVVMDGTAFNYFDKTLTSYTDTAKGEELGEVLPSLTWLKPDARLKGLVGMANGIMLAYYDNVVCASEAYVPYAWPIDYQQTVKYPIVGIGAFGGSAVILTRGSPYIVNGADPSSLSLSEMPSPQACVSARSIVSVEGGVLYASPDGICLADNNGVQVLTLGLMAQEEWKKFDLANTFAAFHEGVYYITSVGAPYCIGLDLIAKKIVSLDAFGSTFFLDKFNDRLYAASGTGIKALFAALTRRTATYKTGVFNIAKQQPFAWLQVFSDFSASVIVKWYGDGVLRHTATVTSVAPVRLPPGRYLEHQIEIVSAAIVTSVVFAGSTLELQSV